MKLAVGIIIALSLGVFVGRLTIEDDNDRPRNGTTGLPENCRAYVQTAINGYRARTYSADEAMGGLERNCGVLGHSWKNMR